MNSRNKMLIKNTSILSFGTICTKGIMFLMTPLFTRWLSVSEYGTFDLMVTYVSLLMPLLTLTSGEAVFRFLLDEKKAERKENVLSTAFVINLVGIILSIIIGIILILFVKFNSMTTGAFLFYLSMEIFYSYSMMAMRGEKKMYIYSLGNILYVVGLAVFVTLFVFVLDLGLAGILLGYACGDVIAICVMMYLSKVYKNIDLFKANVLMFKEIIQYTLPRIPNAISWWIIHASDRSLISLFLGTSFNAIYAVANKIPTLCNTFFNVFHLSWQQSAIETLEDVDRDDYYSSVMSNMISIVGSICILVLGINYWFFKLLFSKEYFAGYYQVPILVVAIMFSMMGQFIGGIFVAQMKSKLNGSTTVMAAVVNLVVNLFLIKYLGLYAASLSTLIAYLALFFVRYISVKKTINLQINRKARYVIGLVICIAVMSYIPLELLKMSIIFIVFVVVGIINVGYFKILVKRIMRKK